MSADNWTICHICSKRIAEEFRKKIEGIKSLYGKIPADEYVQKIKEADKTPKVESTLREDYCTYIQDGILYIDYSAGCSVCSFSFKYKKERSNIIKVQTDDN